MNRREMDRGWLAWPAAVCLVLLCLLASTMPVAAEPIWKTWKNCENDSPLCNAYTHFDWDECEIAIGERPCRWLKDPDGKVRVSFLLNPEGDAFDLLSTKQLVGAVENAMRTWEDVNPNLELTLAGLTDAPPSTMVGHPLGYVPEPLWPAYDTVGVKATTWFDGLNVIGWLPTAPNEAAMRARAQMGGLPGVETDIALYGTSRSYIWEPCYRWCPDVLLPPIDPDPLVTEITGQQTSYSYPGDIQWVLTHELGHALGLDHPIFGQGSDPNCGLTMSNCRSIDHKTRGKSDVPADDPRWRIRGPSTVGIGDIRGLKLLYPWKCPKPVTHAYRYLCHTRQIAVP